MLGRYTTSPRRRRRIAGESSARLGSAGSVWWRPVRTVDRGRRPGPFRLGPTCGGRAAARLAVARLAVAARRPGPRGPTCGLVRCRLVSMSDTSRWTAARPGRVRLSVGLGAGAACHGSRGRARVDTSRGVHEPEVAAAVRASRGGAGQAPSVGELRAAGELGFQPGLRHRLGQTKLVRLRGRSDRGRRYIAGTESRPTYTRRP
jgi:hypothetical protein